MATPKPKEHPVKCLCGAMMKLRYSPKFKGGNWFYGCPTWPKCDGTHGCHQASGLPLGKPADKETKEWRIKAHAAFDTLWKKEEGGRFKRGWAYAWMAKQLNLTPEENHIGMMDIAMCRRVVAEVNLLKEKDFE